MRDEYSAGRGPQAGRRLWAGQPLGRRARWAVPAGAAVAVAAVVAGTSLAAGAQAAAPTLPTRTAAELLADTQAAGPGPMTGTVSETAHLGLPSIPGITDSAAGAAGPDGSGPASGLSLLTGTHSFNLWYANPTHVRVAEPVQLGESDVRRDGQQLWLWSSKSQTATHVILPAQPRRQAVATPSTPLTPEQAARQVLAAVGPTTAVSLQRNIRIAGQDAYQLALAPKNAGSLIGQVRIAIDASKYLPLRVQVFARGASSPAFQVGFTALSFGQPAASNFSFTPPPGAKVKTVHVPAGPAAAPGALPGSQRLATKRSGSLSPVTGGVRPTSGTGQPTVLGHSWLSVLVFPAGGPVGIPTAHPSAIKTTGARFPQAMIRHFKLSAGNEQVVVDPRTGQIVQAAQTQQGPGSPVVFNSSASAGPDADILGLLLKATTPVHGAWGSGRLLRTTLLSVLITSKGTVLVGAVTPSVLYADAAGLK
jgi:outer membrane lipoprotein-sorting protein